MVLGKDGPKRTGNITNLSSKNLNNDMVKEMIFNQGLGGLKRSKRKIQKKSVKNLGPIARRMEEIYRKEKMIYANTAWRARL